MEACKHRAERVRCVVRVYVESLTRYTGKGAGYVQLPHARLSYPSYCTPAVLLHSHAEHFNTKQPDSTVVTDFGLVATVQVTRGSTHRHAHPRPLLFPLSRPTCTVDARPLRLTRHKQNSAPRIAYGTIGTPRRHTCIPTLPVIPMLPSGVPALRRSRESLHSLRMSPRRLHSAPSRELRESRVGALS